MASDKRTPSISYAEIQRRVRERAEALRKAREIARRREKVWTKGRREVSAAAPEPAGQRPPEDAGAREAASGEQPMVDVLALHAELEGVSHALGALLRKLEQQSPDERHFIVETPMELKSCAQVEQELEGFRSASLKEALREDSGDAAAERDDTAQDER